jgi:site-specific recombinase XerD
VTLEETIARFDTEYLRFHRITEGRCREQKLVVAAFLAIVEDNQRTVSEMTSGDLQQYAGLLMDSGLHVNTVRKKMNMIRAFATWAYGANVINADQYLRLKAVKHPRGATGEAKPNPYNRTEIVRFWAMLDAALPKLPESGRCSRAIQRWLDGKGPWGRVWRHALRLQTDCQIRLALDLGLRAGEIYGLSVDDLHYDNEYIVIWGKADPNTGEKKHREVPYTTEARKTVHTWLEFRALMKPDHNRPWLSCYSDWRNNPMTHDRFSELLPDVIGPGWGWHRFRHTCATEWLRSGMELEKVRRLLGHATIHQTLCYAQIVTGDLASAMARHEATFNEAVAPLAA